MRFLPELRDGANVWQTGRIGGAYLAESNAGDAATGYGWLKAWAPEGELTDCASGTLSAAEQGVFAVTGLRVMDPAVPNLGAAGMLAPIPFADSAPDLDLMGTAVLEDLGFALRGNRERLESVGAGGEPVRLAGGYAAAPATAPILANVLGCPVACFPHVPASAIGAAICAAASTGDMSLADASEVLTPRPEIHDPDVTQAPAFVDHYQRWLELRRRFEGFVQEAL